MANCKYEYVRNFETVDKCLPNCWIVIRLDGKNFHRFSDDHSFVKPNDERALGLMRQSAENVMNEFKDVVIAYGQSDEFSFVLKKTTTQFSRRASKLMSNMVSLFSSSYVYHWKNFFGDVPLLYPPAFDGRVVLYPSDKNMRDYLSWRQADCHINNLYNTCFWSLVKDGGCSPKEAEEKLRGTFASDKNEMLFSQFGINYNNLPEIFRKGSVLIWKLSEDEGSKENNEEGDNGPKVIRRRRKVKCLHVDVIRDTFWTEHPEILSGT